MPKDHEKDRKIGRKAGKNGKKLGKIWGKPQTCADHSPFSPPRGCGAPAAPHLLR